MRNITQEDALFNNSPMKTEKFVNFIDKFNSSEFWPLSREYARRVGLRLSMLAGDAEKAGESAKRVAYYRKRGERVAGCASTLHAKFCPDCAEHNITRAFLCHDRACPVCGTLRSARLAKRVSVAAKKAGGRFLHVILTIKNPPAGELKQSIKKLQTAFTKLMKFERMRGFSQGYVRALEVKPSDDGVTWHPHFHIFFRVEDSYFTSPLYLDQMELILLWNLALGVIRYIPPREEWLNLFADPTFRARVHHQVRISVADVGGVAEVCKYICKTQELLDMTMPMFREWIDAVRSVRLWTAGGALKIKQSEVDEIDDVTDGAVNPDICVSCGAHMQEADLYCDSYGRYKMLNYEIDWDGFKRYNKMRRAREREEAKILAKQLDEERLQDAVMSSRM